MLDWEECASLARLSPQEIAVLEEAMPSEEFIKFVITPYLYEEPLKDRPGVQEFMREDIAAALRNGSFDFSAILKMGLRARLVEQGYAGELPAAK